jgi:hypothetical protein
MTTDELGEFMTDVLADTHARHYEVSIRSWLSFCQPRLARAKFPVISCRLA